MSDFGKKLRKRGAKAVRDLYHDAETRVLAAEGRRSVRRKTQAAVAITKKAAKTGLIVGVTAAALVLVKQARKSRRAD